MQIGLLMELTDAMLNHVFKQLDALNLGKKIKIIEVAPNFPDNWIECAKVYQDTHGTLKFKDDFKEVKKVLPFHQRIEDGIWNPKKKPSLPGFLIS